MTKIGLAYHPKSEAARLCAEEIRARIANTVPDVWLASAWDDGAGLIIITADHGNLEDLSHRHHTPNRVPTFLIGRGRHAFGVGLTDLTHFPPAILEALA